jgi:hypothetical protein
VYFDIFFIVVIFDTCEYTYVKLVTTLANAPSKVGAWKYAARAQNYVGAVLPEGTHFSKWCHFI